MPFQHPGAWNPPSCQISGNSLNPELSQGAREPKWKGWKLQSMALGTLRLICLAEGDTIDIVGFSKMQGHGYLAPLQIQPLLHATHACDDHGLKIGGDGPES